MITTIMYTYTYTHNRGASSDNGHNNNGTPKDKRKHRCNMGSMHSVFTAIVLTYIRAHTHTQQRSII